MPQFRQVCIQGLERGRLLRFQGRVGGFDSQPSQIVAVGQPLIGWGWCWIPCNSRRRVRSRLSGVP